MRTYSLTVQVEDESDVVEALEKAAADLRRMEDAPDPTSPLGGIMPSAIGVDEGAAWEAEGGFSASFFRHE